MTQLHLSEKQWTAIVAVGWVLVSVSATFAQSHRYEGAGVRYLQTLYHMAPNAGAVVRSRV